MFDIHTTHAAAYRVAYDGTTFRFVDSNESYAKLTGLRAADYPGLTPHALYATSVADELVRRYRACLSGEAVSYETSAVIGGRPRSWRSTLFAAVTPGGEATIYGISSPSDQPPCERDLPALVLGMLDGGYWTLDLATRTFRTSPRLAEKLAGPGHDALNLAEYVSHIHAEDLMLELPDGEGEMVVEFRVYTFESRMRWLRTRRRPVRDEMGRTVKIVGIVLDITDEKTALLRLQAEAVTDNLTNIGNRRAFDRAASKRFGDEVSGGIGVVLIDLDGFKPINDRHGHAIGDALLREVAERLRPVAGESDLLARIGGDEFAILVADATSDAIGAVVARVDDAFAAPFHVAGHAITIAASCGSAVRSSSDRSIGDILARADRALYADKGLRKGDRDEPRLTA